MKYITILLLFIQCGANAQEHVIKYGDGTSIIDIDSTCIKFEKQQAGFILGANYRQIIISKTVYHVQANKYYVFGLIEDNNHNGNDSLKTSIVVYKGEDIAYRTETSWNGAFSFVLKKNEIARFNEEGYYTDLKIQCADKLK